MPAGIRSYSPNLVLPSQSTRAPIASATDCTGAIVTFFIRDFSRQPCASGYLEENDLTLPVLLDHEGVAAIAYQVAFIPATYLIDEEGVIRFSKVGPVAPGEVDGWLEQLDAGG